MTRHQELTPRRLGKSCREVEARWPGAVLLPNAVGNLTVVLKDEYVGWLDLRTGAVEAVPWVDQAPSTEVSSA